MTAPALEAVELLVERDWLREDKRRIDLQGALKEIREGIDAQLKHYCQAIQGWSSD